MLPSAPAAATTGQRSLATVLAQDGSGFDRNWRDFDILDNAVSAVLKAKPDSAVKVLADGSQRLTAFLPTDRAFRRLVADLTGKRPRTERATFKRLAAAAGVDTIETVLLYHVVAGKTLTSPTVVAAAEQGTKLVTAQGGKVKVVNRKGNITLVDRDPDLADPVVILNGIDVNRGNRQVGHAIDRVLLPLDI
jgi:uncharacterized surface protein with fasciclin (FAS1) repeats